MKHLFKALALATLITLPAQAETTRPVVVELFTSQGCSSCPPADVYLGELSHRDDLLALSFSITYWDYIGWKDPFAKPEFTDRQKNYVAAMGNRTVYTPQMVIDGEAHAVGSDKSDVETKIEAAKRRHRIVSGLTVHLEKTAAGVRVDLPAGRPVIDGSAAVYAVTFDREHETEVERGENRGRVITNYNVVRSLRKLGTWNGDALSLDIAMDAAAMTAGQSLAVIVQQEGPRQVLGASAITF